MARGATSSLLMLSLEALLLLVAGFSAAAVSGDSETDIIIRLPTHVVRSVSSGSGGDCAVDPQSIYNRLISRASASTGGGGVADLVTAMASAITHDGEERPWECCDKLLCTRSFPPICRCADVVDQCSSACKQCEETEDARHTCADWYRTDVGERIPTCYDHGAPRHVDAAAAARVTKVGGDDDEKRPWKCCNRALCARLFPPICFCADEVKQCASTCERCEHVEEGSEVYRCLDGYQGDPGPKCEEEWAPAVVASAHRFFLARKERSI